MSETEAGTHARSLVRKIAGGDRSAESELVVRYGRSVLEMLRYRTKNPELADDLYQDTFRIVLERLRGKGLAEPEKLAAFIHRTAVNLVIGDARKTTRRATYPDQDTIYATPDEKPDSLSELLHQEERSAIRDVINELGTPRDREILHRSYVLDQDKAIVCSALELSSEHFDRVISRARSRFRKTFIARYERYQQ